MELPSRAFYGGALRAHPSVAGRTLATVLPGADLDAPPLLFLDSAGKGWEEVAPEGSESLENPGEAEVVVARARALLAEGLGPPQIAVITPYRAQAARMGPLLEPLGIEVDTVDAFQGREAEAVLVSCVRSNAEGRLGFLTDLRGMNVALTRARCTPSWWGTAPPWAATRSMRGSSSVPRHWCVPERLGVGGSRENCKICIAVSADCRFVNGEGSCNPPSSPDPGSTGAGMAPASTRGGANGTHLREHRAAVLRRRRVCGFCASNRTGKSRNTAAEASFRRAPWRSCCCRRA
jgi:hypothetical protein